MPAIVLADRERRVVSVSEKAKSLLGDSAQEALGKPLDDLLGRITAGNLGGPPPDCLLLIVQDGCSETDSGGSVGTEANAVSVDRSRMEHLEARVAMLEEQRKSMVSTLAHDIRSPLGVIAGAVGELETDPASLSAEHKMMFGLIRRSADRLARLAASLLDYLYIEEGRLAVQPMAADFAEIVRNAVGDARERTDRRGVNVECKLADALPVVVDAQRVREAVLHLVNTALRQARGHVSVKLEETGNEAVLEVTDDRPQVEPEDVTHAFDAFVAERKGKGTFELAIARGLVEAHGGKVSAEAVNPSFKDGVRFRVALPLKRQSPN